MERMERTAWAGAAVRSTPMRAGTASRTPNRAAVDIPDVPAWDVVDVPASTIEALRGEVSALRERLAQAAPKRVVVEMDRAINLLNRRVEDIREAGATERDGRERTFARELAELKAALETLRNPERFRAFEAGLDALSRKIDLLGAKAVDPVEVARLQGQLGELKELVGRAITGPQAQNGLQQIAERLSACAEGVARAGDETARRVAQAAVAFERNAEALLARVEHMEARAQAGDAAATEDLRRSLLAALEGVHRRLDEVSSHVSQQVAALSPAFGAELNQRLGTLLARITAAEEAGKAAVAPLADVVERHLLALTEQFRDTHARLGRLEDIESSLKHMADEMRQVRETTHSVAADAVRAVTAKVSEEPGGPAVVGLKRGLAALEARQDEIERRTSELLADQLELELRDMTVSLGREDGEDIWAPRPAPSPRSTAEMRESDLESHLESGLDDDPEEAAMEPAPPAAADRAPDAEPRTQAQPQAHPEAQSPLAGDMPWPRARRVDWGQGELNHTEVPQGEGGDARPRVGERRGKMRREQKPDRKARKAGIFTRKGHVAMVALIAGATTIFAGTAVGLAWRNGPDLLSGVTSAVRRLAVPAESASTASLPAPIGTPALQSAARSGDPAAAFVVARRYAESGDLDASIKWLGFAVSQGSAPAAHRLGAIYETEKRDLGEARRFYDWAAEQGNVRAMHALAMLLSEGTLPGAGGKPDWDGALRWFRTAANLGHRDSQYNLGVVYARGLGLAVDLGEAWKWLSLAAAQGDEDSARKRDIVARDTDTATLTRAQQAMAAFVPGAQNAAANAVTTKPEWDAGEDSQGVANVPAKASGGATQLATQVASRSTAQVK